MRTVGVLVALCAALAASAAQAAPPPPGQDPFYGYGGATPLKDIAPGTVLKTRTLAFHLAGLPLPVRTVQLLYRSTDSVGQPSVNVTSILRPAGDTTNKVVSYQSAYDSLNPDDEPSYQIAGGKLTLGSVLPNIESALYLPLLRKGFAIAVPDTEGAAADFADGPEYGRNTLDGLRAALQSSATGLAPDTKIGLIGYSGGAIGTEWAAELAPSYAPDVNGRLVGAAMGGVLVDPAHNLHYVEGSTIWAGVMPMAIVGVARGFHIDLTPYMSDYGIQLYNKLQKASIVQVLGAYPRLTWAQLAKPEYAQPESVGIYVHVANQLIMGTGGTPTTPLYIAQGAGGELEGTPGNKPGIGKGDGVMIAGDVRTLARQYCDKGATVQYQQFDRLSHTLTVLPWIANAMPWLQDRFTGAAAPQNCASIAPGNPITPIPEG